MSDPDTFTSALAVTKSNSSQKRKFWNKVCPLNNSINNFCWLWLRILASLALTTVAALTPLLYWLYLYRHTLWRQRDVKLLQVTGKWFNTRWSSIRNSLKTWDCWLAGVVLIIVKILVWLHGVAWLYSLCDWKQDNQCVTHLRLEDPEEHCANLN